jgi:hypothetical protein
MVGLLGSRAISCTILITESLKFSICAVCLLWATAKLDNWVFNSIKSESEKDRFSGGRGGGPLVGLVEVLLDSLVV